MHLQRYSRHWAHLGELVDESRINDDARFVEDLGAESMQSVELIAAFEEELDIEMDEEEALGVKTVGDAVEFIAKHLD
jgi:acyl carrier protein